MTSYWWPHKLLSLILILRTHMQQATMLRKETKIMLPGNVNYEAQSAELIYSLFMHTQQQKMFFEYVC